jgi:hypothetical protein
MEKFCAFLLGLAIGTAGIAFAVWIGHLIKKRRTPVVVPPSKISYKPPFIGYDYLPDEYVIKVRESTDPDEVDDAEYEKRMKALKKEVSKQARTPPPKKTFVERFTAANQPSPEAPSPPPPASDCSADHSSGVGAGS